MAIIHAAVLEVYLMRTKMNKNSEIGNSFAKVIRSSLLHTQQFGSKLRTLNRCNIVDLQHGGKHKMTPLSLSPVHYASAVM